MKIRIFFNFFMLFSIILNEEKKVDLNILKGMEYDDFINKELLVKDTITIVDKDKKKSEKDRKLLQNQNFNPNGVNQPMQPLYYPSVAPMMQSMMGQPMYPQMVSQPYYQQQPFMKTSVPNQLNLQVQPIIRNGQAYYPMNTNKDIKETEKKDIIQEKNKQNKPEKKLKEVIKNTDLKKNVVKTKLKIKKNDKKPKKLVLLPAFPDEIKLNLKSHAESELTHNPYFCFEEKTVILHTCSQYCSKIYPEYKLTTHGIGKKKALMALTKNDKIGRYAINISIIAAKRAAELALFVATGIPPIINPLDLLILDDGCDRCASLVKEQMFFSCLALKVTYKFTPIKKENYEWFRDNIRLCQHAATHCMMKYYAVECQRDINGTYPECVKKRSECEEAAKYACINYEIIEKEIDKEFEKVFNGFRSMVCVKCTIESKDRSKKRCGSDVSCLKEWGDKTEMACEGACKGETDEHYYYHRFRRIIRFFMKRQDGNCSGCEDICQAEKHKYCYNIDERCNEFFQKNCTHFCKYKDCPGYVKNHDKYPKRGDKFSEYIRNRLTVVMARLKVHQNLRNEFDEVLEKKTRELAFRELRDNIINGFEVNEDMIYFKQSKLVKEQLDKSKIFESEFIKNAENLLLKKEKYDKYSEYAIFEEI